MRLFVEDMLTFEKKADTELEEDATQWPRQVLTELFRVLPEISEYTPDVKFMKVSEEQGFALGVVVVTNATNSALTSQGQVQGPQSPKALIPLVIKNGKLAPLDTVMSSSGRMYPLTVDRLREVLYRPESFEMLTDDWGDNSLSALFSPPGGRGDFGTGNSSGGPGGVSYMQGPGMKQASILDAIEGTVLEDDAEKLAHSLAEDPALREALLGNPSSLEVLCKLAAQEHVGEKQAAVYQGVLQDMHPAQVVSMRWDEDAQLYAVKTANRDFGVFRSFHLDRGDFLRFAGDKLAARVDKEGTVVASDDGGGKAVVVFGNNGETPRKIETSGNFDTYNAQTGQRYHGVAIPELVDAEGNHQPLVLFVCEHGATVQGEVAGTSNWSEQYDLPKEPPRGRGCFYSGRVNGGLRATVPVQVKGSQSTGTSISYSCIDMTGEQLKVTLQRGTEAIIAFPKRKEILMPWNAGFVGLEPELPALVDTGESPIDKVASMLLEGRLTVSANPGELDSYRIRAHNVPKLASAIEVSHMTYDDALFNLCVAGLGAEQAFEALNKVAYEGRCEVTCQDIGEMPAVDKGKIAAGIQEIRALRPGLWKEAASIPDSMTVDAVLGLDFINSENVRTFISMIPYLEKALNKTCELVFAARLGLSEIPEAAAARAARGLNDAVRGLKGLALRQIEDLP